MIFGTQADDEEAWRQTLPTDSWRAEKQMSAWKLDQPTGISKDLLTVRNTGLLTKAARAYQVGADLCHNADVDL